jgi:predicted MFS family arabinose efflux permease
VFLGLAALQRDVGAIAVVAVGLGTVFAPFAVETTRALIASTSGTTATPLLWTMTLLVLGNATGAAAAGAVVDRAGWWAASASVAIIVGLIAAVLALARPRVPRQAYERG